jgi:amino acid permease
VVSFMSFPGGDDGVPQPLPVLPRTFFTAFVFNVNVLMGSGILAMPYAFYIAGYALGSVVLFIFGVLSYMTICYNFEAQMRTLILATAVYEGACRLQERSTGSDQHSPSARLLSTRQLPAAHAVSPARSAVKKAAQGSSDDDEPAGKPKRRVSIHPDGVDAPSATAHEPTCRRISLAAADEDGHRRSSLDPNNPCLTRLSVMEQLLEMLVLRRESMPLFSALPIERVNAPSTPSAQPQLFDNAVNADGIVFPDADIDFGLHQVDFDHFSPDDYWEINDILLLYGGRISMYGWNVCNVLFQIAILWTFSVVLGSTATLGVPIVGLTAGKARCNSNDDDFADRSECLSAIRIYLFVFAAFMIVLTARDWGFMPILQRVLGVVVYVCVGIILVTCIVAMATHDFPGASDDTRASDGAYVQSIDVWDMSGFGGLFGICVFALLCHSATILVLRQMPSTKIVKKVFAAAFGAIGILYAAMGLVVAFYIGNRVEKVATLDWSVYQEWGANGWVGTAIGNIVLFFPVLSITPGFVLRTRSLCDAVESMIPVEAKTWMSATLLRTPYLRSGKGVVYRFQLALRVLAIVIALALSLITYKFETAVQVAGCAGFTILYLFPMVSEIGSRRLLTNLGLPSETPYHGWISARPLYWVLAVLGLVSFCYYFYCDFIFPPTTPKTGLQN